MTVICIQVAPPANPDVAALSDEDLERAVAQTRYLPLRIDPAG